VTDASENGSAAPPARTPLFYIGAVALLLAMAVDASSVMARHLGWTLTGSIELVQASILVASASAVVAATLARRHARVHLLVDRLQPHARDVIRRVGSALSAIFFVLLAAGEIWIASDLWSGHEESELLHIPYAPLRIVAIVALLGAASILSRQSFARERR
jgi:TRAP-type transport system small permease protein